MTKLSRENFLWQFGAARDVETINVYLADRAVVQRSKGKFIVVRLAYIPDLVHFVKKFFISYTSFNPKALRPSCPGQHSCLGLTVSQPGLSCQRLPWRWPGTTRCLLTLSLPASQVKKEPMSWRRFTVWPLPPIQFPSLVRLASGEGRVLVAPRG